MKKVSLKKMLTVLTIMLFAGLFVHSAQAAESVNVSIENFRISYVGSSYIQVRYNLPYSDITCDLQLLDVNKNLMAVAQPTSSSGTASLNAIIKDNKVYYYRIRPVYRTWNSSSRSYLRNYIGPWSPYRAVCTVKLKAKLLKRSKISEKVTLPKVRGVKNAKISISKKKDSGYKKVKTLKPGKSYVVTKCGKNKLKKYINYYLKPTVKLNDGVPCDSAYVSKFCVYTVYR